ncbi:MAG: hypothetical protein PHT69_12965 [Bacteroidales bacterium]|nr:hypothetical protein [Bacteroidales bacterium]
MEFSHFQKNIRGRLQATVLSWNLLCFAANSHAKTIFFFSFCHGLKPVAINIVPRWGTLGSSL